MDNLLLENDISENNQEKAFQMKGEKLREESTLFFVGSLTKTLHSIIKISFNEYSFLKIIQTPEWNGI